MSNEAFTGLLGSATAAGDKICNLTKWELEDEVKIGSYVSNCSGGGTSKVVGAADARGTFEVAIEGDSKAPLNRGDSVALVLDAGGPEGTTPGTNTASCDAKIKSRKIVVDVGSEQPVAWVFSFEVDGVVTYAGALESGSGNCCGATPP